MCVLHYGVRILGGLNPFQNPYLNLTFAPKGLEPALASVVHYMMKCLLVSEGCTAMHIRFELYELLAVNL